MSPSAIGPTRLKFAACAVVLMTALAPMGAMGSELCSRSGDVVTVSVPATSSISFIRDGGELRVSIGGQPAGGACAGMTPSNTASLSVVLAAGPVSNYRDVNVDLSGGLFGIRIDVAEMGDPKPTLEVWGSTGPDTISAGTLGIDLDADAELDLAFDPGIFQQIHVAADLGNDVVSAAGGDGVGLPVPIHVNLVGNEGDDYLTGGSGHDLIDGREGFDTVHGGLGGDFCWDAEESTSCENPVDYQSPRWSVSCTPGIVAAECSGGGSGDEEDGGLGAGATLRGGAGGLLPGSGTVVGTGRLSGFAFIDEPAHSISIRTHHEVDWADIDIRNAVGTASAVLTVRAYNLDCQLTCATSVSRVIVDSISGPSRVQREGFWLNLIMTNGDELVPRSAVFVDVILTLAAELGAGPVPSIGSVHVTTTMSLNSVAIYPDQ